MEKYIIVTCNRMVESVRPDNHTLVKLPFEQRKTNHLCYSGWKKKEKIGCT